MNFFDAVKLAHEKESLIGRKYQGAVLDEIVIVPTSANDYKQFQNMYKDSLNAQQSIAPFMNCDVTVMGVYNKSAIIKEGYLIISQLPDEL